MQSLYASPATQTRSARPLVSFENDWGATGLDQRQHRRARANWAARIINSAGNVNTGRVCDVSEGGFGLISAVHMPAGALLDVAVAVPRIGSAERSVPVRCKVRVVACAFVGVESRLSVKFLALPKESRIAIRDFVIGHA